MDTITDTYKVDKYFVNLDRKHFNQFTMSHMFCVIITKMLPKGAISVLQIFLSLISVLMSIRNTREKDITHYFINLLGNIGGNMYKHHEESVENMKEYFRKQGVIALILIGSVAKGTERADSDLDCAVILSEEEYAEKEKRNITTETVDGLCTYEGGYFDIKYMTKKYIKELAEKGSEPARNTFTKARILFCNDTEIEDILPRIPVFQKREKEEKLLSFYSDFWLNYYYYFKSCPIDGYMKMRTIAEIIYSLYRIILQEKEILFDCNRRLEKQVESISEETAELVRLGRQLEISQDMQDADKFVDKFREITSYMPPEDIGVVLTRYSKDFQEWWREPRPNINEW